MKTSRGRKYLGCAGATLLLATIPAGRVPLEAHDPDVILFGEGTAVVDGVMSPGEWDNAGHVAFQAVLPASEGGGTTPATLYVMNDATNLYLAVRVQRSSMDSSSVAFEFDNDHDGLREDGDDGILVNRHPIFGATLYDNYRAACSYGPLCAFTDAQEGGTSDGQVAAENDGTYSVYELSHPLDSADDPYDFGLSPGDVVGFQLQMRFLVGLQNWPADYGDTYFPTPFVEAAHEFGDIIITPIVSPIDIKPGTSQNKIKMTSQGVIPVAILSTGSFSAPTEIDADTLTFGRTGDEQSLSHYSVEDVNGDGLLDLIAHFHTQLTGFQPGDTVGILKGQKTNGTTFVGTDSVQIMP